MLATAVRDGSVKLSDPALVDASPLRLIQPSGTPIRWIDLATHTSGLPRLPENMVPVAADNPYANYDSTRLVEFLSGYQTTTTPGQQFEYSNLGFAVLGRLVADAAGTDYATILQDRIANPLGMKGCRVDLSDDDRQRFATPHASVGVETSSWQFADLPEGRGHSGNRRGL